METIAAIVVLFLSNIVWTYLYIQLQDNNRKQVTDLTKLVKANNLQEFEIFKSLDEPKPEVKEEDDGLVDIDDITYETIKQSHDSRK
jgi:hypothetical protein